MKTIKKVKYKSGDLILRKNGGLILLVTHGLGHFSHPRTPAPPENKCGLSVGNRCGWNPEMGTENQEVMWQVWDVWVLFGFSGGYTLKRMYVRSSKLSMPGWKALVA